MNIDVKLLVVTSEPISAAQLREALGGQADPTNAEVMVVAPALQPSAFRFWMSDADDAIARAEQVRRESVERLRADGVASASETGEADPVQAIQDALQSLPADRVIVFAHTEGDDSQRYREDLDPAELEARFGVPVQRAPLSG